MLTDLTRMTSPTTGANNVVALGVALPGFRSFAQAGVPDGATVSVGIGDNGGSPAQSLTGRGIYSAGAQTVTIEEIFASTNSGAMIPLSGSAQIAITSVAADIIPQSMFATRAAAVNATIDPSINFITTGGYATAGDGGGARYYKATGSTTGGFQSEDGAWWGLNETFVNPRMFGAVGNGVTDDSAAFQAAINWAAIFGGGLVFVPPGNFAIYTPLTISNAVRLVGSGGGPVGGTTLFAGPRTALQDHSIIVFTGQWGSAENMVLYGCGAPISGNVPPSFGATQPVVKFASGAVSCKASRLYIWGGGYCISCNPGSGDNKIEDCLGAYAYQSAVFYAQGVSVFLQRNKFDQDWPVSEPSGHPTINSWAANTSYSVGTVVTSQNYYLQAATPGISGSSAPTLQNYDTPISDGTTGLTWLLVGGTGYYAYQFDTGVPVAQMDQCDCAGCFAAGIALTNTLNGAAPSNIAMAKTTPGQNIVAGILLQAGNNLDLTDMNIGAPVAASTAGIHVTSTWTGDLTVKGGVIFTGVNGIQIDGGTNAMIDTVKIFGMSGSGVLVQAGVSQFSVTDCPFSSATLGVCTTSVTVLPGDSDAYVITNNIIGGAGAVSDGGTGTHKNVSNNV